MSGAVLTNPVATGSSVFHLCCDGLEDFLHMRPRIFVSSRHDRRSKARTFFAARNTRPDKQNALRGQILCPPGRISVERIAAIDEDVTRFQMRKNLIDCLV